MNDGDEPRPEQPAAAAEDRETNPPAAMPDAPAAQPQPEHSLTPAAAPEPSTPTEPPGIEPSTPATEATPTEPPGIEPSTLTTEATPTEPPSTEQTPTTEATPTEPAATEPAAVVDRSVGAGPAPAAPPPAPGATRRAQRPPGRVVEGVVTTVSSDEVELTLDDGRPAVISRRNFSETNEDPTSLLAVGDRAFGAELARDDPKSRVVLSRAWALKRQAWSRVKEAADAGTLVKGTVTSIGGKGLVVDVGVRGFVPSSHLELEPVADLAAYRDKVLELKVLECDPRRERLVLSRRSLLLKEQRAQAQKLLASLSRGDTCRGKVTSIADYGAFVDIGGVNGLVHVSELSWQRVRKPGDVVALGDEIEVRVLDVKPKKRRISLSLRQMRPDPLTELVVGEVRRGPVTRLVDFGAFVSLGDVEGLVHLSELAEYRVSAPEEIVTPGDEVGVKILSVDRKRRRVELSIRRAAEFDG